MKKLRIDAGKIDSEHVALLFGISVGLGIVVHEAFFLVAGVIAGAALTVAAAHAMREHAARPRLAHQHH
jgi:hypothetical protein